MDESGIELRSPVKDPCRLLTPTVNSACIVSKAPLQGLLQAAELSGKNILEVVTTVMRDPPYTSRQIAVLSSL